MRVGQPGVHREQADLGAVTEHRQHEGQPDHGRAAAVRPRCQQRPERQVVGVPEHLGTRVVGEDRPQQGDGQPGRGEQDVLPGRLGGAVGALDRDEQRRDDRGHLDGDPQQRQVAHQRGGQHRPGEQVQPGPEPARVPRVARPAVAGGAR